MALFTSTPIPVLAVDPLITGAGPYSSKKLFKHGTVRYVLGVEQFPAGVHRQVIAVKSLDGGATWSAVLGTTPTDFTPGGECFVYDAAAEKIHIFAHKAAPPFHLFYFFFDLTTDSYSAPVDSGQAATQMVAALKSGGDLFVVFNGANIGDSMQIATVSGAVWGPFDTLVAGSPDIFLFPVGLLLDGSDNAKIVFQQDNNLPTYSPRRVRLFYMSYDAGIPSAPAIAEDLGVAAQNYTMGPGLLWNNRLLWANYSLNTISPHIVRLFVGTPVAAPVWTKIDVAALVGSNFSDFGPDLVLVGAEPWILWVDNKRTAPFTAQVNACCYDGAAIGAQHIAWDTYANPVPGSEGLPAGDRDVFFNSAIVPAGRAGELIAVTEIDENDIFQETYCFLTGEFPACSGSALEVVCNAPPDGRVALPYSHTFLSFGGIPPVVFSITAGALPSGLSLDAAGVVSGIPTLGGLYTFTVTVTDAGDNTASVECTIQILCPFNAAGV